MAHPVRGISDTVRVPVENRFEGVGMGFSRSWQAVEPHLFPPWQVAYQSWIVQIPVFPALRNPMGVRKAYRSVRKANGLTLCTDSGVAADQPNQHQSNEVEPARRLPISVAACVHSTPNGRTESSRSELCCFNL